MSFSGTVKDELSKKDFTEIKKAYNMGNDEPRNEHVEEFLRKAFLETGAITDPNKDYHLEFICRDSTEVQAISRALRLFSLDPKHTERGKHELVYLKDASQIADVLRIIGAHDALMEFENVRILKEVSENVNRRVNFETANINRTVCASMRQIEEIELIRDKIGLDTLDDGLRELAELRLSAPDASLEELAMGLKEPIGKSGVNHRMRKLRKIAEGLREKN